MTQMITTMLINAETKLRIIVDPNPETAGLL
jgi:hypothetical protein